MEIYAYYGGAYNNFRRDCKTNDNFTCRWSVNVRSFGFRIKYN